MRDQSMPGNGGEATHWAPRTASSVWITNSTSGIGSVDVIMASLMLARAARVREWRSGSKLLT